MIFFSTIAPNLADSILDSLLDLNLSAPDEGPFFELSHTDVASIEKLLRKMSVSKATGSDGIPTCLLKINP